MASEIHQATKWTHDTPREAELRQSVRVCPDTGGFQPSTINALDLNCLASPTVPGQVRTLLSHRLAEWGLESAHFMELTEDLRLIVTELVTNACEATPERPIRVLCQRDITRRRIRVAVWDSSPERPESRKPDDLALDQLGLSKEALDANRGRGLPIVMALSEHIGVTPTINGKWVWSITPVHPPLLEGDTPGP